MLTGLVTQNTHKTIHKTAQGKTQNGIIRNFIPPRVVSKPDPVTGFYNPFPTYSYTGSVRPVYPLSPRRTVPKSIPHPDWSETGIPTSENRLNRKKIDILDAKGIEAMRKVCRLGREVLDIVAAELKPGITTDYLDEVCHNACVERKVRSAPSGRRALS
jgi:methionyl aminopeptidase